VIGQLIGQDLMAKSSISGVTDGIPAVGANGFPHFPSSLGSIPSSLLDDLVITANCPPIEWVSYVIHK